MDGGTDVPVSEMDLNYRFSSKDNKWAMYNAYLGDEDDWMSPPEEFLPQTTPQSRIEYLKNRSRSFMETFTAHGPFRFYSNQNIIRKLIWFVIFNVLVGYGIYQCVIILMEYFDYPTLTSLRVEHEKGPINFPAVTICNLNPLNTKNDLAHHSIYGAFVEVQEKLKEADCDLKIERPDFGNEADALLEGDYSDGDYYEADYQYDYLGDLDYYTTDYTTTDWNTESTSENSNWNSDYTTEDSNWSQESNTDDSTGGNTELTTEDSNWNTESTTEDSNWSPESNTDDSTGGNTESTTEDSNWSPESNTDDSSGGSTGSTTEDSTDGNTESTTEDSTHGNTESTESSAEPSLFPTAGSSTESSAEPSLFPATGSSTESSAEPSLFPSTGPSTESSAEPSIFPSTGSSTDYSTESRTESSANYSTGTSTESSVESSTESHTESSIESSTDGTTESSTGGTTESSTDGTTESSTDKATESSTDGNTESTTEESSLKRKKRSEMSSETDENLEGYEESFQNANYDNKNHSRKKRETLEFEKIELMDYWDQEIRIKCSFIYQHLVLMTSKPSFKSILTYPGGVYVPTLEAYGVKFGDMSNCPDPDFKDEKVIYNKKCKKTIYIDTRGAYYNMVEEVTLMNPTEEKRSLPCIKSNKTYSYSDVYRTHINESISVARVKGLIHRSKTSDLSDMYGQFSPSQKDLKGNITRSPKELIETCSMNNNPCSHLFFNEFYTPDYGFCYTFNSPHLSENYLTDAERRKKFKPRASSKVGPKSGLRLTLNLHSEQYVSLLSPNTGLRISIHDSWEAPFPSENGFDLAPGKSHSIGIRRTYKILAPKPHGDCTDSSYSKYDYSKTLCEKLCIEKQYRYRCKCAVSVGDIYSALRDIATEARYSQYDEYYYDDSYEYAFNDDLYSADYGHEFNDSKLCNPFLLEHEVCLKAVKTLINDKHIDCGCTEKCRYFEYKSQVTSTEENKEFLNIVRNIKKTDTGGDICTNSTGVMRVHVYIQNDEYDVIEEKPAFTWATLISNMGGNLGLFVGISIISLIEILDYLVDVLLILISPSLYELTHSMWGKSKVHDSQSAKRKPKRVFILAGPTQYLPHGSGKPRPLSDKASKKAKFNQIFMSDECQYEP